MITKMTKLLTIITIISFLKIDTTLSIFTCNKNKYKGPFEMKAVDENQLFIGVNKVKVQLINFPDKIEVIIATRRRFINYCYDGTWIDPNTGCEKHEYNVYPTRAEVLKWKKSAKCFTGKECGQEGDCWGSFASECWKKYDSYNTVGSELMGDRYTKWTLFAEHTCTQRWSCSFHVDEFPIYAIYDFPNFIPYTGDIHGKTINITKESISYGVPNDNRDAILHFVGDYPIPEISYPEANCFSPNPKVISCVLNIQTSEGNKLVAFETKGKQITCLRNHCIKILTPITTVSKDNTLMELTPIKGSDDLDLNLFQPPTKESVRESINTNRATQIQSDYNIIQLHNDILKIKEVIMKIVKSSSKIDDELIGNILNQHAKSKWINDEIFQLFECDNTKPFGQSNCIDGIPYNRRKLQDNNNETCFTLHRRKVIPFFLFLNESLNLELVDQFNPDTSSTQ